MGEMHDNGYEYEEDYDGYVDEEEEEIQMAERELAEDAQWKVIQKNTFTRWANQHLKVSNLVIDDLQFDLADGIKLVNLVQELSGSKFRHIHKRPNFRTQKLENITMVLRFLEESEGLRLVNIDSTDISDNRLKLILGLIWTLILHYSITMPLWEGEDPNSKTRDGSGPSPRQRLLGWINAKMPHKPVKNFTTDWNDGTAIGSLVDACAPGLCPNWSQWDPRQGARNAGEALDSAEQYLNVPQLIRPHEMANPKVDEKAMMTYLSQFPSATLQKDAPLRPKTNPMRVQAYGPGLELEGNMIGAPAKFTVDTFNAGQGTLDVIVLNPKGQKEPCEIVPIREKDMAFACCYVPTMEGEYRVIIKYAGTEVPNSPFKVNVTSAAGDSTKVVASGPGIEPTGNEAGRRTFFNIFTTGAGSGAVDCVILDPTGKRDTIKPKITKQSEDKYLVEYTPKDEGLHSVNVFFAGYQIPSSPYGVMVGPTCDSKLAYATGRGIQPEGLRVRDLADFQVHTEDAGFGELAVSVFGPGGNLEKCQVKKSSPHLYDCSYVPQRPGPYVVDIKYGNNPIHQSPFHVEVGPYKESKIKAYGPGLSGGIQNKPAFFTVETNGETGALGFSIKGPSEAKIDCVDNGDGSANVTYWPTVPGEYAVHVLCDDENIPKSPFMAQIEPDNKPYDPSKVTAYGPGLNPGVQVNKPTDFTVDATKAKAPAPAKIECYDKTGQLVPVQARDNKDGTYTCRYTPKQPGKHNVIVAYGGVNIPNSPYRVDVTESSHPGNVKVYGPGIEKAKRNQETYFVVDCSKAGPGDIGISVLDERMRDVPVVTEDNGDGTFRIKYTPVTAGPTYTVQVFFSDAEVANSPYKVKILSDFDPRKYRVDNLPASVPIHQPTEFDIVVPREASGPMSPGGGAAPQKVRPEVTVRSPTGQKVPVKLQETIDGFAASFTPTQLGPHTVALEAAGVPLGNSPYKVQVTDSIDAHPYGSQDDPMTFDADYVTDSRPFGGPLQSAPVNRFGQQPVNQGLIEPVARANEEFIKPVSKPKAEAGKRSPNVTAYGEGLRSGTANKPSSFVIDSSQEPPAPLGVTIEGPMEAPIDYQDNGDGTCNVNYVPREPGQYNINVMYDNQHIPSSPFTATVQPDPSQSRPDLSKITAYGPGLDPRGVYKDSFAKFTVNAKPVDPLGKGQVKAILTNPLNQRSTCSADNNRDGTYSCSYSPIMEGLHKVDISYDGGPAGHSPYKVPVLAGSDVSRVRAYGPGLESGVTNEPQHFTVDLEGAGQGGLGLSIEGPADAQIQCHDNKDGTCSVQYMPVKAGPYDVTVKFNEQDIPGSPFHVPIRDTVDPSKVRCWGPGLEQGNVRAHQPAEFTVDCSHAGEAPLQVEVTDPTAPGRPTQAAQVTPKTAPGVFNAVYVPPSEGPCEVAVKYGGQHVPGSPFLVSPTASCEPDKVVVTGEGVRPCRGFLPAGPSSPPSMFTVNTRDAGEGDLELVALGPNQEPVSLDVDNNSDGTFTCQYRHPQPGQYTVKVLYGDRNVPGSPFIVPVYAEARSDQCYIDGPVASEVPVGKTVNIPVNTQKAGNGTLTSKNIGPMGNMVPVNVDLERPGHSNVTYLPQTQGPYELQILYNDQPIPNGNIRQYAVQPKEQVTTERVTNVYRTERTEVRPMVSTEFNLVDFKFPVGPVFDYVSAVVNCPSGRRDRPRLIDNRDGTITVQYQPVESGPHELEVLYNGVPIPGSPFQFYVDSVGSGNGQVTAHGPGLSYGRPEMPAQFTIVTRDAGPGGLSLAVEGPSKAEIQCHDNHDGSCSVSYLPLVPGDYHISIKFLDKHIVGSPFTARIFGEPKKRSQICVGTTSDVPLKISETDIHNLTAVVTSPSGREESCTLKRLANGYLGISFTPREVGEHLVNVLRNSRHIPNSPFKIYVAENEIGNAAKVRLYGDGLREGMANEVSQFVVDTRDAGYGGLSLSIEGPSKVEIECRDNHDGTCLVTYVPTEPGTYIVNVRYADQLVPGCPYAVNVGGIHTGSTQQRILRHQQAAEVSQIGNSCELNLIIPGYRPRDISASVTSPSGVVEYCEVLPIDDSRVTVRFMPKELGVHTVSVKSLNRHVPGSPFQFTVGPLVDGGPHKVQVTGPGIDSGLANDYNQFFIYTREAGAGSLSIAIEGPSKAEIDFQDNKDGSCAVTYRVNESGDYTCSVKFNDEHVSGSPFSLHIGENYNPSSSQQLYKSKNLVFNDRRDMSVAAMQDQGLTIGTKANFIVNYQGFAEGRIEAYVVSPSNREQPATVSRVDAAQNGGQYQYSVHFVPSENGVHLVHVMVDGEPIPGSPYRVAVGQVTVSGQGIRQGRTGQLNEFLVDTSGAGGSSGPLTVTIDGPSKVQLNCREAESGGYHFSYVPAVPGQYTIAIKYGGGSVATGSSHIVGSPFLVPIVGDYMQTNESVREVKTQTVHMMSSGQAQTGPSKPHNVICEGDGLTTAQIGKPNEFVVDAGTAGSDVLYVGVHGPVRPCEEVNIKHIGDNRFQIHYHVKEHGRHMLMVRWGNQDVPGSPFEIYVPQ